MISKLNRHLTGGSSRFQPVSLNNDNRPEPEGTTGQPGMSFKVAFHFFFEQATNKVGLVSVQSYGAYAVDASPPIQGHVYDGNPELKTSNQKDQDFQTDTTTLHAFWEGFHDPHSSLIGYWWRVGSCQLCDDVLPEQYIGLETGLFCTPYMLFKF